METLTKHQKKDIRLIGKFVEVYCDGKHGAAERTPLQSAGGSWGSAASARNARSSWSTPSPSGSNARWKRKNRAASIAGSIAMTGRAGEKVQEIMAYSGRKLMLRGRLDYIWHYFF